MISFPPSKHKFEYNFSDSAISDNRRSGGVDVSISPEVRIPHKLLPSTLERIVITMPQILIKDIRLPMTEKSDTAIVEAKKRVRSLHGSLCADNYEIYKSSVDARRRENITIVWSVTAHTEKLPSADILQKSGISVLAEPELSPLRGERKLSARPVVCGFGPAGMFAALILAENGYRPIVIERGDDTDERVRKVERFCKDGVLDTESNIQFGAGGAGTFSDGKLVTRINDPKCRYVLQRFFEFGAPKDVLTRAKPHVGTDILRNVVSNIRDRIIASGGEILFRTKLLGYTCNSTGEITALRTTGGDIPCGALILATGHSARDIYSLLLSSECAIKEKPFSVGLRIEHLKQDIDRAMYGSEKLADILGSAEYACSLRKDGRAVYTFCMCPGGEVVAAASENGGVVVNGMSRHARNGKNSNSAIAVSVTPEDCRQFGGTMAFQRKIERNAFELGGSDYCAPIQTVGDFLAGKTGSSPTRIKPSYMENSGHVRLADLSRLFPEEINDMLRLGIRRFNSEVSGFSAPDAWLTGAETRTSSPYRILRNDFGVSEIHQNLYPCGEGAGYAGGITSAAVDGIAQACRLMEIFAPIDRM